MQLLIPNTVPQVLKSKKPVIKNLIKEPNILKHHGLGDFQTNSIMEQSDVLTSEPSQQIEFDVCLLQKGILKECISCSSIYSCNDKLKLKCFDSETSNEASHHEIVDWDHQVNKIRTVIKEDEDSEDNCLTGCETYILELISNMD